MCAGRNLEPNTLCLVLMVLITLRPEDLSFVSNLKHSKLCASFETWSTESCVPNLKPEARADVSHRPTSAKYTLPFLR